MPPVEPLLYHRPPAPVATEYRVGLCAWQDRSMLERGRFYPRRSMSAAERLWWYARFFDCVEVNSTFYAPLAEQSARLWAARTPPGFLFGVKAYALLTGHHLDARRLPEPLRAMLPASARPGARGQYDNALFPPEARQWALEAFREALRPLADAGKLGYLLFQMAPWVRFAPAALAYLAGLPAAFPGAVVAVELRDPSWLPGQTDQTLRALAAHGATYVVPDHPGTPGTVARTLALTSPVAILRLHGRNAAGFMRQLRGEQPTVAEKYGYLYGREEIEEIVTRARALEGHARRVYVQMNNNEEDAPAVNGLEIRALLGQEVPDRAAVEADWRARWRPGPRRGGPPGASGRGLRPPGGC